jgi:two-component system chemotaxis sensor kinase CheA
VTRGRFISVGWKLAGSTVAVVAVLAVSAHAVVSRHERETLMRSKQAAADMLIRLVAAGLSAPLSFSDQRGVAEQVGLLAANEEVVYGAAWSISMEQPDRIGERLGELKRGARVVGAPDTIPRTLQLEMGEALVARAPVVDPSGATVGVVAIAFSLEKERAAMEASERRTLLFSLAAAGVLAALLLLIARRWIVAPLRMLVQAANVLERGEKATIEATANDEIGRLARALQTMSEAIRDRETSLSARNRDMRLILDNAGEGFLTVLADGALSEERSRMVDRWFGAPEAGAGFVDWFTRIAGPAGEWMQLGWESLEAGFLPLEVAVAQLPRRFENGGRHFALEYRPIGEGDRLSAMLVVVRDITAEVERQRAGEVQKEALQIFTRLTQDRIGFGAFMAECRELIDSLASSDVSTVRRDVHTLKGNAGLYGLECFAALCHELESRMCDEDRGLTDAEAEAISSAWRSIEETAAQLGPTSDSYLRLDFADQARLLEAIRTGASRQTLTEIVTALSYEPAWRRLEAISVQVKALGRRYGREVEVHLEPTELRLPPQPWSKLWRALVHVFRNAIDHGVEDPAERVQLGKSAHGNVVLSLDRVGSEIVLGFSDDGRGIAWDAIAAKAARIGLRAETRADLERVLYAGAVSSAGAVTELSGRGVGLSAVHAAVESLGGRIIIESEAGAGTSLRFVFPEGVLREEAA